MNIPAADLVALKYVFAHVAIVGRDGKIKLMAKCKKCNHIIVSNNVEKWKHWKNLCISKYQFEYIHATKIGVKMNVSCLVCHKEFHTITNAFMQEHRSKCTKAQQEVAQKPQNQPIDEAAPSNTNSVNKSFNNNPSRSVLSTSAQNVEAANQSTASTSTLNQVRVGSVDLNQATNVVRIDVNAFHYNLKTLKRFPDNKDIQCAECRICKKYFSMHLILIHRAECKVLEQCQSVQNEEQSSEQYQSVQNEEQSSETDESEANRQADVAEQEPEILISVQTVHTESTNVQPKQSSNKTKSTPIPILPKSPSCHICNSSDEIPFINMYRTVSAHTKTNIYNFICRFLGGKPLNKNKAIDSLNQDVVCYKCLNTINEYDAALVTARRCKKQLSDKLAKKEVHIENGNAKDSQAETSRIGLAKKRDFIDLCNDD